MYYATHNNSLLSREQGNMSGKTVVADCPLCLCFMTNIKVTNMKKKTQQGNMSGKTVADSFVLLCVTLGGGDPSLPPISQIAPQIILFQTYLPFKHISLLQQQNVKSAFKL